MNVSAWCIKNPIPSVMLFVMLTLAGLLGFSSMKVQQFPDIGPRHGMRAVAVMIRRPA